MHLLILLTLLLGQEQVFPVTDPKPAVESARKKAREENRRVLILTGSNTSEASRAIATMFKKDKEVARVILYEYDVVLVGMLEMGQSEAGFPLMAITDSEGKELYRGAAPAEPKSMTELLKNHQAPPLKAQDVLDAAKKRAAAEKKRVLLTLGAPW